VVGVRYTAPVGDIPQLGFTFEAPARRIWTVQDLVGAVRTRLEREYTDVFVEGEISNLRPAESGHLYFTLKDGGAQLRVVMFRSQARLLRFKPENGLQIIARGRVTVYDARGELQLSAEYLEPRGAGALQIAFEQLKQRLAAEGLFDAARKKPLPPLPRRIGIVTSPRAAALQDILNILRRRHHSAHVLIWPAQVQGDAAASEVAAGIKFFNRAAKQEKFAVDVIIVARGGGSIEDLAAFNDEGLARTVAASELPVISAVGHETDFTIIDFVADLRAPTPSAAAELVIRTRQDLEERVEASRARLARAARYRLLIAQKELSQRAQHGAFAAICQLIGRRQQRVDELSYRLAELERGRLQQFRRRLDFCGGRIHQYDLRRTLAAIHRDVNLRSGAVLSATRQVLALKHARVDALAARLESLSPLKVMERGYAVVFDEAGNAVKDSSQLTPGSRARARFHRGSADLTVNKTAN
jgi:exodeoxyribonuclease VII large subunit